MLRRTVLVAVVVSAALAASASSDRSFYQNAREMARAAATNPRGPRPDVQAQAANETFNVIQVVTPSGAVAAAALPDASGNGAVAVYKGAVPTSSPRVIVGVSDLGAGGIVVFDQAGAPKYVLDGDSGLVSASADLAEAFPAIEPAPAGSVMVIDPGKPGHLRVSRQPYDRRVAGVISGARNYQPGITLGALGKPESQARVTLTGTVYCLATNLNGPIRAGDLLTTSLVPGHAMRATVPEASRGAILGKAMEDLQGERGYVLILASLQ